MPARKEASTEATPPPQAPLPAESTCDGKTSVPRPNQVPPSTRPPSRQTQHRGTTRVADRDDTATLRPSPNGYKGSEASTIDCCQQPPGPATTRKRDVFG